MVSEIILWALTVPIAGFYGWAMWTWPRLSLRITAAVVFFALWFAAPAVTSVDVVWRFTMPAILVLAMLALLVRWPRATKRRNAD